MAEVVVVGGGIIGLSVAWRLQQEGIQAVVVDPASGSGASHAAAGMLAPVHEARWSHRHVLRLHLAASDVWPGFAEELGAETVDYQRLGMLRVAFDDDDRAVLDDLCDLHEAENLPAQRLRSSECRRMEPMLAPGIRAGLFSDMDHHVDPRLVVAELLRRVQVEQAAATAVQPHSVCLDDGRELHAEHVVVAAGAWTKRLLDVPVRPVKGQILRLAAPPGLLGLPICGIVRGAFIYVLPRRSGEIVVGATQEEQGFDTRVTTEGVYELLRDALQLLPGLREAELVETTAGLRPGSPDDAPVIGSDEREVIFATGHFRNGVLLAPLTAEAVTALVTGRQPPAEVAPFSPTRFASAPQQEVAR